MCVRGWRSRSVTSARMYGDDGCCRLRALISGQNTRSVRADVMRVHPRTVLYTLVGAHMVNDFYVTVLPAFLPAVADEFDLDYTELGILSFAFVLLTGVLQPVLGNTADRYGRRRWMMIFGFVVGAIGFLAMAAAPSFWFIVAVSLVAGLGGATYHPQANAYIVGAYPERRGRMLGIHGWGGSLGHFLAPAVAVFAIAAFSWRAAMAAVAIPLLVAAAIVRAKLREAPPAPAVSLRSLVSRRLLIVAVSFGLVGMVGRSFLTFFIKMLVDEGWQETDAGVLLTAILLLGAVAQPVGGWAYDRIGGRRVILLAASSTAILVAVFALSDGVLSLVAIAGITFFQFMLLPVGLAAASELVPPERIATASGLTFGISGLMVGVAQPAVGFLAESLGDIRIALSWLLPIALLAIAVAVRIADGESERDGLPHRLTSTHHESSQ